LKIEIRKDLKKIETEQAIAYSKYSNTQVLLNIVSLKEMMRSKINVSLDRKEIRDIFDIEFLLKKGIDLDAQYERLSAILKLIDSFKKKDYTVKLGSIIEQDQRRYYVNENFKILKMAIKEKITSIK
jgi:predicted nucleotidyltransferase component of viral defense system